MAKLSHSIEKLVASQSIFPLDTSVSIRASHLAMSSGIRGEGPSHSVKRTRPRFPGKGPPSSTLISVTTSMVPLFNYPVVHLHSRGGAIISVPTETSFSGSPGSCAVKALLALFTRPILTEAHV